MPSSLRPVVLFFAFANNRVDPALYLRNLPEEQRRVRAAMAPAVQAGLCEVVERANVTADEVLGVFQDMTYRDRIAVFHFGGHADSGELLLESAAGEAAAAYAPGLARFLGEQRGLKLIFLNGCSSKGHVQGLLDAGVSAVVATSCSIDDEVATEFAAHFYAALASGTSIRTAYVEASGAVQMNFDPSMLRDLDAVPVPPDETWPWGLYPADGAEESLDRWSLPRAAGDSLFGLPPVPELDFPSSPFRYLASFSRKEALVFFGRGPQIRELFDALTLPDGAPIVLLFGAAGVGKSSLLAAGLQPRLEMDYDVLYLRRDRARGLAGTLAQGLASGTGTPSEMIAAAWRLREAETGRPLLVMLDQAEEAWTRPLSSVIEAEELAAALRPLFRDRQARPRGRLLLGFRKEWLAEVLRLLDAAELPSRRVELAPLDFQGITEAVAGLPSSARMRRHYGLRVEPDLPGILAVDLLVDPDATVAPALQILLTKMWSRAIHASPAAPCFTVTLYQSMKRNGILLDDFLEEQLQSLADWRLEFVSSGLLLDLLTFHTTSLGSAETRNSTEVVERYGGSQEIIEFLEGCQDRYLLTIAAPDQEGHQRTTRLAHDTLAPLVRRRFETSDRPGQRALRILEQRVREWKDGKEGPSLDEFDLAQVEAGQRGMRVRTPDEERLVAASRQHSARRRRQRLGLQIAAVVAVAMILGLALWALQQRTQALGFAEKSRERTIEATAIKLVSDDPTQAALILLEAHQPDSAHTTNDSLRLLLGEPLEVSILKGHTDSVQDASFSPDGTRLVTASADGTVRIWSAATGEQIAILKGHTEAVDHASFSQDGSRILTASSDGTARIWSVTTGQPIAILKSPPIHREAFYPGFYSASFSPDGTRVLTATDDGAVRIWSVATEHVIATLDEYTPSGTIYAAAFSPDGTRVVGSRGNTARIWNIATGKPIATLEGHTSEVTAVSYSPDGSEIVTGSRDGSAAIWDTSSYKPTFLDGQDWVRSVSFSRDSELVATASDDGTARIWSRDGTFIATLRGHTNMVTAVAFSPDGSRVVTGSADKTARIWTFANGQEILTFKPNTKGGFNAVSFSPDGSKVVTASDYGVAQIWDAVTGQSTVTLKDPMNEAIIEGAQILDPFTGEVSGELWTGLSLEAISFSPDGTRILTASESGEAVLWSIATAEPIATLTTGDRDNGFHVASFSPDGNRIVTVSNDGKVVLWSVATAKSTVTLAAEDGDDTVLTASFSSDGTRLLTASEGGEAVLWSVATGKPIVTLREPEHHAFHAASFSPDGAHVVTASTDIALIWSVATGRVIATLKGHRGNIDAASFSPDGTKVVTASREDYTARVWNAATGEPIVVFPHRGQVYSAAFSPDSTRVVTTDYDSAHIWLAAGEGLQSRVRARTRLCLQADQRQTLLGESFFEAQVRETACKDCLPGFFARLQGIPSGDSQRYLTAWLEYQRCFRAQKVR